MTEPVDIQRWNSSTHQYEPYLVPEGVNLVLYSQDMSLRVPCAGCFQPVAYGDSFTSRVLHTRIGLGYPVCEPCYYANFDV